MRIYYLLFLVLLAMHLQAQDVFKDSLNNLNDKELLSLYKKFKGDTIKTEKIMRIYLNRAQAKKDTLKMARGYYGLATIKKSTIVKSLNFADSVIFLSKNLNNKDNVIKAYILKGLIYYGKEDLMLATKNFTDAYKLALKNKNFRMQTYISDQLISLKSIWGNKQEALELQKKRHELLTKEKYLKSLKETANKNATTYEELYLDSFLSSMQNFVICYTNLKVLDSASYYIEKGIQNITNHKDRDQRYFYNWFTAASMEVNYHSKDYKKVILIGNKLLTTIYIDANYNRGAITDLYYFNGLSYIKLDKHKQGIKHLLKTDSIFEHKNISPQPYHRDLFVELLGYYSLRNNTKMKKKYANKLIVIDSIIKKNREFLEPNLIRNYETPQLLEKKEEVITELKQKNKKTSTKVWWMFAFLTISLLTILYYFKRQQLYRKRFDNLILQQEFSKTKDIEVVSESENEETIITNREIPSKIEIDILNHLNDFELKKSYLSKEVSLQNMAKAFGTNYNYLSKVINLEKGKSFTNYINDLRIEYSFDELKSNQKLRKYTIKSIAKECGFGSAESFSKKFYKKYGIYPSYYIKNLKKLNVKKNP